MVDIGVSQEELVSRWEGEHQPGHGKSRRLPQYVASLASTLGALAAGMVLGWTSPAGSNGVLVAQVYGIPISVEEFSWIGSLAALGAGAICVPIGLLCDVIGRKYAMLAMVVPFTAGWLLIIFADSVLMFYLGRFITGLSGGAFCVTAPMYSAEIAEKEIRGSLGSYFQLLLTVGILLTYALGVGLNIRVVSIISAIMPIVFFCVFLFMPETPTYYLKKGNTQAARQSLQRLRGPDYNVEHELQEQKDAIDEAARKRVSFFEAILSRAAMKGLVIAFGLMFFQQLSGVNSVIFYSSDIFKKAGSTMEPNISAVVVGAMQVIAVFVSTTVVDKLGRRLLLIGSMISMFVTTFILGVYFYLSTIEVDTSAIQWIPLVSVCVFIILFSLGFGPIPWMMVGEIFAPEVKGIAGSSACLFNWLMAFLVTKFYSNLNEAIGIAGTFWIFSGICAIGVFFVFFLVPETKGKTLQQIQSELAA